MANKKTAQEVIADIEARLEALNVDGAKPAVSPETKERNSGRQWSNPAISPYGLNINQQPDAVQSSIANLARYGVPAATALASSTGPGALVNIGRMFAGGVAGEQLAQELEVASGDRAKRKPGEAVAMGVANTIPGGRILKSAGVNVLAETARAVIDEGKLPSWKASGIAAIIGGGAGGAGRLTSSRVLSESAVLKKAREDSFRKMKKLGFKINPNDLSESDGLLSWLAGNAPLDVEISRHNQIAAQKLARKAIGAKVNGKPFRPTTYEKTGAVKTRGELEDLINEAEAPYRKLRDISVAASEGRGVVGLTSEQVKTVAGAENALDKIKVVRRDANRAWQARNTDPEAYGRYEALKLQEKMLEDSIEEAAELASVPGLLDELKDARRRIARIHVVKNATPPEDGIFNMAELPAMRSVKGIRLTDDLQDLEEFAFHFDKSALNARQAARDVPSNLNTAVMSRQAADLSPSAGGGMLGPILGQRARNALQSPIYQNVFTGLPRARSPNLASEALRVGLMERGRDGEAAMAEIIRQSQQ